MGCCDALTFVSCRVCILILSFLGIISLLIVGAAVGWGAPMPLADPGSNSTTTVQANVVILVYQSVFFASTLLSLIFFDSYWDGIRRCYNQYKYIELLVTTPLIVFTVTIYTNMTRWSQSVFPFLQFAGILILAYSEYLRSLPKIKTSGDRKGVCCAPKTQTSGSIKNKQKHSCEDFICCGNIFRVAENGLKHKGMTTTGKNAGCYAFFSRALCSCSGRYPRDEFQDTLDPVDKEKQDSNDAREADREIDEFMPNYEKYIYYGLLFFGFVIVFTIWFYLILAYSRTKQNVSTTVQTIVGDSLTYFALIYSYIIIALFGRPLYHYAEIAHVWTTYMFCLSIFGLAYANS